MSNNNDCDQLDYSIYINQRRYMQKCPTSIHRIHYQEVYIHFQSLIANCWLIAVIIY